MRSASLLFFLLGILCLPDGSQAQNATGIPELTIKVGKDRVPLALRDLAVSVEVEGIFAETIYELEFYNHTNRQQEGEFSIQLPPDATVSSYALEVTGRMRPGVSVEKERARNAYESIKRQMVDPGLVEREAGNVYRTRIFPILGESSKRVRIGFVHRIPANGEFVLPLAHPRAIPKFTCTVRGGDEDPELKNDGTAVPGKFAFGAWKTELQNVTLNGALQVQSEIPTKGQPLQRVETAPDGTTHFVVQSLIEKPIEKKQNKEKWKRVRLVWDASFSGRWRDQEKDLYALRRIWKWIGEGEVSLQVLGESLSEPRTFSIQEGEAADLEKHLKSIPFDGIADFSLLKPEKFPTLLVSDGQTSSPVWEVDHGIRFENLYLLNSSVELADPGFLESGAREISLTQASWFGSFQKIDSVLQVPDLPGEEWNSSLHGPFYVVSGRMIKEVAGPVRIRPPGSPETRIIRNQPDQSAEEWNLARRIWAQRRLEELEWNREPMAITSFAKSERLVSDHTSLIVLERFLDHLRYRIPPPEPDLLTRYHEEMKERETRKQNRALSNWKKKQEWHGTRFPWIDADLESELATVSIWVKSSQKAFPEEKRNEEALRPYEEWIPKAKEVIQSKDNLNTGPEFKNWTKKLDETLSELNKIRENPVAPAKGAPVHVSVRGFVNSRGIYSRKAPYLLREAIQSAGGINNFGSLSRVYLYRDAERTGFNMESPKYESVPLRWGDMIVVEDGPQHWDLDGFGFADPFAAPVADPFMAASPASGGAGPPVFEDSGSRKVRHDDQTPDWFLSTRSSVKEEETPMAGRFVASNLPVSLGLDQEIIDELKANVDPAKHYRTLLQGKWGKGAVSVPTTIEIARVLFQKKQPELATIVLSNLCELQENTFEATRSFAYWLVEFGEKKRAVKILEALVKKAPDEETRALISFDLGRVSGRSDWFRKTVEAELRSEAPTALTVIALTDYYAKGGQARDELADFRENEMPSDIRIVITLVGGSITPKFNEPVAPAAGAGTGQWVATHERVHEFQRRRAFPGSYGASVLRWDVEEVPLTLRADYYVRWASDREEKHSRTFLLNARELELDSIEFGWEE